LKQASFFEPAGVVVENRVSLKPNYQSQVLLGQICETLSTFSVIILFMKYLYIFVDVFNVDDQEEEDEENETPDDETINQVKIQRINKVSKSSDVH